MIPHDTPAAIAFLNNWQPGGPWVLTAIHPQTRQTETRTFHDASSATAWINAKQGIWNLYFTVNPTRMALNIKAKKSDMAALAWLHLDVDPRAGEDPENERKLVFARLNEFTPRPTVIIDSGGGLQAFWKLAEPQPHTGENTEALESFSRRLADQLGGDHCHNIDRIMRLPGTINVPDEKKRQKGRVPRCARIVEEDWSRIYPLDVFTPAAPQAPVGEAVTVVLAQTLPAVDVEALPVSASCKVLIMQGHNPKEPDKYPSRSHALFAVCCEMVRRGCDDNTIAATILNPTFRISESVLDKPNPQKYAIRQIEQARQKTQEEPAPAEPDDNLAALEELNTKHFVVSNYGGRCLVAAQDECPVLKRRWWVFQRLEDFRNRYLHRTVTEGVGKDRRTYKLGRWWLEHPLRRQYDQVTFAPAMEVEPNIFNLWTGFAFAPTPGDLHLRYLKHVEENICGGNKESYQYLLRWMARVVQVPGKQGEVAVVLIGGKGVGKGQFANHFGRLFGRHYVTITDPRHLTGNFNAHLHDCVLLFADEVVAVNKQQEGVLKALVTEPTIMLERKGVDVVTVSNFTHIIMASNNSHVVPYSPDERRYFVLKVQPAQQKNREYFEAITHDLEQGGYAHLLHHLQTLDLKGWNHTAVPFTPEAQNQLMESIGDITAWVVDLLHTGILPGHDLQKDGNPRLMCLKAAAEDIDMNSQKLAHRLKKMGFIESAPSTEKRVYRNPDGVVVSEADKAPGAVLLGRRMYQVRPLAQLREQYAQFAPEGWNLPHLSEWQLADAPEQKALF